MKWFFIALAAYVTISLLINQINFSFPKLELFLKQKFNIGEIPIDYNEYNFLDASIVRFGNHQIEQRFESLYAIQHYIVNDNTMIILSTKRFEENHNLYFGYFLYKLNSSGLVIDSMDFNEQTREDYERFYEGYLINDSKLYYRTWALDGDKTPKAIVVENKDMLWAD
jgi:hypothetical protein